MHIHIPIHTRWRASRRFKMLWPGGVRVARFNPPPPLGTKRAELIFTSLLDPKPQLPPHTLLGQSPKYHLNDLRGSSFLYLFVLGQPFFCLKTLLNFGSSQNVPEG